MSWSYFLDKLPLEISNKIIEYVFDEDVKNTKTFILSNPTKGLLIPKGIWSTQYYLAKINILNVF